MSTWQIPDSASALLEETEAEYREEKIVTHSGFKFDRSSIVVPEEKNIAPIDWLWYPWLARGKMHVAEGASDIGKSLVWLDLSARLSANLPLPDGTRLDRAIGVVYIAYEDDIDDTILPRLQVAGADFSRVRIMTNITIDGETRHLDINNPGHLEAVMLAVEEVNAELLVIDPITSGFTRVQLNDQGEVRNALAPLLAETMKRRISTVYMRHHKKGKAGSLKEQGVGSNAFQEVARLGISFTVDRSDETEETRIFNQMKHNLVKRTKPRAYRIVDVNGTGKISWLGERDLTDSQVYDLAMEEQPRTGQLTADILEYVKLPPDGCKKTYRLVEAMEIMGYKKNNVYTTLSRLVDTGKLNSSVRGTYCLPPPNLHV